jgi:hypothetical protein
MEDGAVASPRLVFASNLDTEVFYVGPNSLGITTAGSSRLATNNAVLVTIAGKRELCFVLENRLYQYMLHIDLLIKSLDAWHLHSLISFLELSRQEMGSQKKGRKDVSRLLAWGASGFDVISLAKD